MHNVIYFPVEPFYVCSWCLRLLRDDCGGNLHFLCLAVPCEWFVLSWCLVGNASHYYVFFTMTIFIGFSLKQLILSSAAEGDGVLH